MRSAAFKLGLISWLIAASAVATNAREVTVKGVGSRACSQWTQSHLSKKSDVVVQETWLAGFITGYNAYGLKADKDVASGVDLREIVSAVSTYCSAHPADDLFRAAGALIIDLQQKSGAK